MPEQEGESGSGLLGRMNAAMVDAAQNVGGIVAVMARNGAYVLIKDSEASPRAAIDAYLQAHYPELYAKHLKASLIREIPQHHTAELDRIRQSKITQLYPKLPA